MDERVTKLLLTPEEAAAALAIGRTKVYELMGSGQLRSVRVGACRRIPEVALREFVARLLENDARKEGARRARPATTQRMAGIHPDETRSEARPVPDEGQGSEARADVAGPGYRPGRALGASERGGGR